MSKRMDPRSTLDIIQKHRSHIPQALSSSTNEVQQGYLETMKGYAASLVELERACGIWDLCF